MTLARDQYVNYLSSIQKPIRKFFTKKIQPLYLQHLRCLIFRAGWTVTKIYSHFSFDQERFKRNFIHINQRLKQAAKDSVEKDFSTRISMFGESNEISYLKKYYNSFDNVVSKFVLTELLERNIDKKTNDGMMRIQKMIHSKTSC